MFCLHRNNCSYTVYMKLMRSVSNYIIGMHFQVFQFLSRLVELQSSDEMKMFYTEHDFQVELVNFKINLKVHEEGIQHKPTKWIICNKAIDSNIEKKT